MDETNSPNSGQIFVDEIIESDKQDQSFESVTLRLATST